MQRSVTRQRKRQQRKESKPRPLLVRNTHARLVGRLLQIRFSSISTRLHKSTYPRLPASIESTSIQPQRNAMPQTLPHGNTTAKSAIMQPTTRPIWTSTSARKSTLRRLKQPNWQSWRLDSTQSPLIAFCLVVIHCTLTDISFKTATMTPRSS